MTPLFIVLSLAIAVALTGLAWRDHARLRASRVSLLNDAAVVLNGSSITLGGDGFPRLQGSYRGFEVRAELIPDTMVVRRLPQLWLSVTLFNSMPGMPGFGILARYSGNEFYALTTKFERTLSPPQGFPHEVLIRAEGHEAQMMLDRLRVPLSGLLADPHNKEVAVTSRGLRLVHQASEGRRGEHLLLRQAIFDTDGVAAAKFKGLLDQLADLADAAGQCTNARAA